MKERQKKKMLCVKIENPRTMQLEDRLSPWVIEAGVMSEMSNINQMLLLIISQDDGLMLLPPLK